MSGMPLSPAAARYCSFLLSLAANSLPESFGEGARISALILPSSSGGSFGVSPP